MFIHLSYILVNILCVLFTNGQIIIKDAGIGKIESTDIGMIFYLTLENICPSEMYISVRGVKCCEMNSLTGQRDCDSMKLMGGDPGILCAGRTKNVSLIYPNLYLYGRRGVCTVLIVYKVGMVTDHFFHRISFDTKRSFQGPSTKICPCYTSDLDPFRNCSPVDCPIKYSGHRNYFNALTKYCDPVPFCRSVPGFPQDEEMYDILHNRCVNVKCTITSFDLASIETRRTVTCPVPYIFGNTICHHGSINKKTGECVCHNKWISNINNEPEFVPTLISSHMCNIRTGSWTELNKDKLLLTILVMVIMTSLCVLKLFFLICILHFCYKWARSRSKEDQQSVCHLYNERGNGSKKSVVYSCSRCSENSKRTSESKRTSRTNCYCSVENIFRYPHHIVACRSQAAMARTDISDKCFQLEMSRTPSNNISATVQCQCGGPIISDKAYQSSSVPMDFLSDSSSSSVHSEESLLGENEETYSVCSTSSSVSPEDGTVMYPTEDTTYFTSTYTTEFYSSNLPRSSTVVGVEGTSQTDSNYSIDMDYETEELELECSSSSDNN